MTATVAFLAELNGALETIANTITLYVVGMYKRLIAFCLTATVSLQPGTLPLESPPVRCACCTVCEGAHIPRELCPKFACAGPQLGMNGAPSQERERMGLSGNGWGLSGAGNGEYKTTGGIPTDCQGHAPPHVPTGDFLLSPLDHIWQWTAGRKVFRGTDTYGEKVHCIALPDPVGECYKCSDS